MFDVIKPLLDSNLITEETRKELSEAWETKLNEAREQVRAELREEFAQRYEHDKNVMVEALDRMVTEGLTTEVQAVAAEKKALAEDRVRFQVKMKESATRFNQFLVTKLAEEIGELRKDRKMHSEGLNKLENFVMQALAREITEFAQDKREVVETKVRLVREARSKLEALKARFIKESAAKMSQSVSKHLRHELTQLQEDIKIARENNFGRRIFEAYAAEFGATHLNEKAELRRLTQLMSDKDVKLAEAIELSEKAKVLVENKNRELRMIRENNERTQIMTELLSPLNQEKAEVMRGLLESVQTTRLKSAFEKYLPAVLEDRRATPRKVVAESVTAVTGNKQTMPVQPEQDTERTNVIELKRLAGL
jgi:hypothetical protein